jgi:hypothetical protein
VEDVGLLIGSVLEAGGDELPDLGGEGGHSTTTAGIVATMGDLDRRLSELTGRTVDLKLLFPVALGAIGIRAAIVNGIGFVEVPAYILIWYAFDAFWKFISIRDRRTLEREAWTRQPQSREASKPSAIGSYRPDNGAAYRQGRP